MNTPTPSQSPGEPHSNGVDGDKPNVGKVNGDGRDTTPPRQPAALKEYGDEDHKERFVRLRKVRKIA